MTSIVTDTSIVFTRELRPLRRDPFSMVFTMVQPLVFLALFGPLLSQVSGLSTSSSLQWFVPGIIVMSALFGASMTGSNLLMEMQTGSQERMLVTPLRRPALLLGRSLKEIVPVLIQALIILAVTIPFGFELHAIGGVIGLAVVATYAVGLASLSHTLAIKSKDNDYIFWAVEQTLLFPLMLLSGMLLPIAGGPGWLRTLSKLNPLTYVVNAERLLFDGHVMNRVVAEGALSAVCVLTVGLIVGMKAIRSGTS